MNTRTRGLICESRLLFAKEQIVEPSDREMQCQTKPRPTHGTGVRRTIALPPLIVPDKRYASGMEVTHAIAER